MKNKMKTQVRTGGVHQADPDERARYHKQIKQQRQQAESKNKSQTAPPGDQPGKNKTAGKAGDK